MDDYISNEGLFEYLWTHALISDETHAGIKTYCDYVSGHFPKKCYRYISQGATEIGQIDIYNIYAPLCDNTTQKLQSTGSVSL